MKKLKRILLVLAGFAGLAALSGCVAYAVPYEGGQGPHYRSGPVYGPVYGPAYGPVYGPAYRGGARDRDGDGVRDRDDRRPGDPRRY